jgi:probable phosphoglycerate mutase
MATGLRVDAIFTSPLGRAQRTAEIISAAIGVEAISLPELAEIHHGVIAGLCYADIQRDHPDVIEGRRKDKYHYRFPGGESYADADTRARAALAALARSGSRYPLIVSHEMIGRMLLRNLLSQDVHEALQWQHPHNVIYGVDVRAGTVDRIQQEGLTLVWPREA